MNKKVKFKINKKFIYFIIFLILSFILWFLNALNRDYTTNLNLPVTFYNFPKNKANITELPSYFIISVKANGFDIVKYEFNKNFNPIKIDLSSSHFYKFDENDTNKFYILTKDYLNDIDFVLLYDMKVENIKPDTLYFHFTKFGVKKVPIELLSDITTANQYVIKDNIISIIPDSAIVSGPQILIDTITKIFTNNIYLKGLSEKTSVNVELNNYNGITISPQNIQLVIDIEQYTEVRFKVPIEIVNLPDSLYLHLFPNFVDIVYKIGFSNYQKIKESDFKVIVDYNSILDNFGSKVNTQIVKYPSKIYEFQHHPEFVEYIIQKK